jgi:hypothetical protein
MSCASKRRNTMKQKLLKKYIIEALEEGKVKWEVWAYLDTRKEARRVKEIYKFRIDTAFDSVPTKFRIVKEEWVLSNTSVIR